MFWKFDRAIYILVGTGSARCVFIAAELLRRKNRVVDASADASLNLHLGGGEREKFGVHTYCWSHNCQHSRLRIKLCLRDRVCVHLTKSSSDFYFLHVSNVPCWCSRSWERGRGSNNVRESWILSNKIIVHFRCTVANRHAIEFSLPASSLSSYAV